MSGISFEEIVGRLNLDEIQSAAQDMVDGIAAHGGWYLALSPGDGTQYHVSVVAKRLRVRDGWQHDGYMVANQFSGLYPWAGQSLHPDYTTDKWGAGNKWTGVVMSELLSRVAALIATTVERAS